MDAKRLDIMVWDAHRLPADVNISGVMPPGPKNIWPQSSHCIILIPKNIKPNWVL